MLLRPLLDGQLGLVFPFSIGVSLFLKNKKYKVKDVLPNPLPLIFSGLVVLRSHTPYCMLRYVVYSMCHNRYYYLLIFQMKTVEALSGGNYKEN